MALEDTLGQAADAAATVSHGLEDQGELVVAEGRLATIQKDQVMRTLLEVGLRSGRVQAANLIGQFAHACAISQVREMRAIYKEAGLSWSETCQIAGLSTQHADRMLRLDAALGEDFIAHSERLGLSFRTLDAAKNLPESVRRSLAQGEVVDLETVSKEALTDAIRRLAGEHAKEKADLEQTLAAERKLSKKALDKGSELTDQVKTLTQELEALREGLVADESRALAALREAERPIVAHMVRLKNTLDLAGRSPAFIARLVSGLEMIRALADLTGSVILARVGGLEPDEETLGAEARQLNQDIAAHDGAAPHPGF